ncbi:MAG: hypothetical protein A3F84_29555 [Candidatus Handelsmanbacteria bacterium RIFCSPLOWO2_12_FULL_64_10]|uniref:Cytochrome c-type biogenesis protein H Ig-like domain-containing protein n=1 Tax=Handelsmanbacteria sp. (strain RIFCSPLOWO2_12_FULL_64_10) TaxID=1817868 RepID=A0A1F6C366_HANXR|nr:MAG: hypothetical protein A3F84_29555 [Candidatus Handelsmanbacteria bacterium RIFCSPLOWO2_12_FULL_64_10]
MRYIRVLCLLAGLIGLACSQNFERGDVNPPAQQAATKPANPHVAAAPQAPQKGMTPMSERTYATDKKLTADEKSVAGTITIAPELAGRIPAGATLFVMAKERAQGGAPYAVLRLPVPAFPFSYSLSQADVLPMFGEGLEFAQIDEMYVVARIDQDGRVGQPDPGDMEGATKTPVKPGQKGVDIVIDKVY